MVPGSILNAPVALDDIVFAEMLWAAIKALFSCVAIMVVIFLLGISRAPTMLLAIPVLGLVGVTFASVALVFNAVAKGYDVGKVDGLPGYKTRRSLGDWQAKNGLAPTCFPDASLKAKLR